ncbi:hypothetical protein [Streptomyces shenzhenensis]|uniref:Uncharacterized protein n=1 Tax=Streptomyces shenzhenensis TaxID=943815 RepID=A0A3M0I7E9_9ACTN|nr:hypothetical protein [Streptomyces shenzhenensis]RMB85127.1 hypothetical protein CTZ28_16095 [Streptomyces shenzhenensis]
MSHKIARRVSLAATTAAVAAAAILAVGGSASAATIEHSDVSAPTSRSVQSTDRHHQGHVDDARSRWVQDQILWLSRDC